MAPPFFGWGGLFFLLKTGFLSVLSVTLAVLEPALDQAALKLRDLPASASRALGLKA